MSSLKPSFEDLAKQIEKSVKEAIQIEVDNTIEKAFEEAKLVAKSKAGSIAVRLAGMVDYQYETNRLIITVRND